MVLLLDSSNHKERTTKLVLRAADLLPLLQKDENDNPEVKREREKREGVVVVVVRLIFVCFFSSFVFFSFFRLVQVHGDQNMEALCWKAPLVCPPFSLPFIFIPFHLITTSNNNKLYIQVNHMDQLSQTSSSSNPPCATAVKYFPSPLSPLPPSSSHPPLSFYNQF